MQAEHRVESRSVSHSSQQNRGGLDGKARAGKRDRIRIGLCGTTIHRRREDDLRRR
jgi:hypothetical protein